MKQEFIAKVAVDQVEKVLAAVRAKYPSRETEKRGIRQCEYTSEDGMLFHDGSLPGPVLEKMRAYVAGFVAGLEA